MDYFSKLGSLKLSDFWRGFLVAVLTAPLTIIYQSLQAGELVFDWKAILTAALTGGAAYLIKNLSSGMNGRMLTNSK